MESKTLTDIALTKEEQGRQAVDSLKGYIYQIYQTLAAWLKLEENEILFVEIAEDYALLLENQLTTVQIKNTKNSGAITLHTTAVQQGIESFWSIQKTNPEKEVHYRYLTTSKLGIEKGLCFPEGRGGLLYWRVAAREGIR